MTDRPEPLTPLHVVPLGDQIEHDLDDECPCGPTADLVPRDDGSMGWVMVHHSLDGRELHEPQEFPSPSLLLGLVVFAILSVLIGLALAWSVSRG